MPHQLQCREDIKRKKEVVNRCSVLPIFLDMEHQDIFVSFVSKDPYGCTSCFKNNCQLSPAFRWALFLAPCT